MSCSKYNLLCKYEDILNKGFIVTNFTLEHVIITDILFTANDVYRLSNLNFYGENRDNIKKQVKCILLKIMLLLKLDLTTKYDKGYMEKDLDDFINSQITLLF